MSQAGKMPIKMFRYHLPLWLNVFPLDGSPSSPTWPFAPSQLSTSPAQPGFSHTLLEAGYTLGCQVSTLVLLSGLLLLPHPLLPYGGFEGSPGGFLH